LVLVAFIIIVNAESGEWLYLKQRGSGDVTSLEKGEEIIKTITLGKVYG
jgi:hypothetical protein